MATTTARVRSPVESFLLIVRMWLRTVRSLIRMTLDSGQTQILEVDDGTAALELARSELPELIFLDWSMPGSSGIEVCRALREDPETARIRRCSPATTRPC